MSINSPSPNRLRLQVIIATENTNGQVRDLRKFLHITQRDKDISDFITEVDDKFRNLYPAERPLTILRVQDENGCDLDLSYQLLDVFEERAIARVIISDDEHAPPRIFSPAGSKLALLQSRHVRQNSFDSNTGYVTPSMSSNNGISPVALQQRPVNGFEQRVANDVSLNTPLTEDTLSRMHMRKISSPELPSPVKPNVTRSTVSPQRKRKRSEEDIAINGSPEDAQTPLTKKRAVNTRAGTTTLKSNSQESNIPETPQKDRRQRTTSPSKRAKQNKDVTGAMDLDLGDTQIVGEENVQSTHEEMTGLNAKLQPAVVISRRSSKSTEPKAAATEDTTTNDAPSIETSEPVVPPKRQTRRMTRKLATETTASNPDPASKETTSTSKPPDDNNAPSNQLPHPEPIKVKKLLKKTISKPTAVSLSNLSSPTSDAASPTNDNVEKPPTSLTSDHSSTSSETDKSEESSKDETDNGEESSKDETDNGEESSKDETGASESDEKMDIDSEEVVVEQKSSPPIKKSIKGISHIANKRTPVKNLPPPLTKSTSGSSPSASDSSESDSSSDSSSGSGSDDSDSDSDSDSKSGSVSGSESGSVSESRPRSPGNDVSASGDSGSDASSSDSDSNSDGSSSSSSSSSSSRASAKSGSASSAKSSANSSVKDDRSSNSSNVAAQTLGGQLSSSPSKPRHTDPILHRANLSQNTDLSPNNGSFSQRSPLLPFGRKESKLKRWNSLSEIHKRMRDDTPKKVNAGKQFEQNNDEESDSESDEDDSDDTSDSEEEESVIPKAKLARAPVSKKRKSGGLKAMFK